MKKITAFITLLLVTFLSSFSIAAQSISISYVQNLNTVPLVTGDLSDAKNRSKTGKVYFVEKSGEYEINIEHTNGTKYILASSGNNPIAVELPGINEYGTLILDSGIYFKGEDGKRYIYYEFQNPASQQTFEKSFFEASDSEKQFLGFRPYVIWNIETGVYDIVDKLTLYAVYYKGTDRRAFADIVFPMDIDDLLMVYLKWNYRYQKLGGLLGWTDWRSDFAIRYEDETVVATNFWHEYKKALKLDYVFRPSTYKLERFKQETIQDLGTVSDTYKYNFVTKVNTYLEKKDIDPVTVTDVFFGNDGYSAYRIYLNTYSAGLYTGYEIDDIVLVDIAYIYKGEYFHPRITDIEWTAVGGIDASVNSNKTVTDYLNEFIKFLDTKFGWFKFPVLIIIGIIILAAINRLWIRIKRFIG